MWRVNSNTGQVQMLRTFGRHAAGVTSIQLHPKVRVRSTSGRRCPASPSRGGGGALMLLLPGQAGSAVACSLY